MIFGGSAASRQAFQRLIQCQGLNEAFAGWGLGRAQGVDRFGIAASLEHIAILEADLGKAARAALLWGAAESLRERIGTPPPPGDAAQHQAMLAGLRSALGSAGVEREMAAGRAMGLAEAIQLAVTE